MVYVRIPRARTTCAGGAKNYIVDGTMSRDPSSLTLWHRSWIVFYVDESGTIFERTLVNTTSLPTLTVYDRILLAQGGWRCPEAFLVSLASFHGSVPLPSIARQRFLLARLSENRQASFRTLATSRETPYTSFTLPLGHKDGKNSFYFDGRHRQHCVFTGDQSD